MFGKALRDHERAEVGVTIITNVLSHPVLERKGAPVDEGRTNAAMPAWAQQLVTDDRMMTGLGHAKRQNTRQREREP